MAHLPKLRSNHQILVLLTALWTGLFIYYEHVVPFNNAARCNWELLDSTNVLLVADPQLIDNHTYPGRNEMLLKLSKHTTDVYLEQNYKALVNHLQPNHIVFLGDYLDNGRLLQDAYYHKEFRRFEGIFNRWPKKYARGKNWFSDVPGNHDIGFGDGVKEHLSQRFAHYFGAPNVVHLFGRLDFILLDTPSYSSSNEKINKASRDFVNLLPLSKNQRVLLSHVPFFRDVEKQPCGPLRENPKFHTLAGYQYQLALSPEILNELLDKIRPSLIFSGDDHDYCDVLHEGSLTSREITVKSISMAMGIRYPAVQLLSYSKEGKFKYNTHMCYLPTPYVDVFAYVVMSVVSAIILLLWNIKQRSSRYNYSILPTWDSEDSTAILMEQGPMSKKVSNFLKEQDEGLTPTAPSALPKYTFTTENRVEKALRKLRLWMLEFHKFVRKWNLVTFLRHCGILAMTAILIYNVTVWTI